MKLWIAIGLLLLAISNVWSYNHGIAVESMRAGAEASAQKAVNAQATTDAVVVERKVEQAAQAAVNEVSFNGVVEQAELVSALAIANGTAERLHRELEATRANLSGQGSYADFGQRSASATQAAMVLSDLYGSCQRRVVELAGAFDQAHSRGMNCSTSYDKVSKVFKDDG